MRPETRYAKSTGGYVGWQAFGDAPRDILFVPSWATNIDAMWDEPSCAFYFGGCRRSVASSASTSAARGVSDPVPLASLPTLEEWMDDALLALDAAGSRRRRRSSATPKAVRWQCCWPRHFRTAYPPSCWSIPSPAGGAPLTIRSACPTRRSRNSWASTSITGARTRRCWPSRRRASAAIATCRNGSCASSASRCRQARRRACTAGC